MENHFDPSASWAQRALRHASEVSNASPGRGSATRAEAQAAEYVKSQLTGLGVADIRQQPFRGLRSIWLFFSLAFGMALVGHAAFWLLRAPIGWPAALVITCMAFAMSAFLLWRKLTFRNYLFWLHLVKFIRFFRNKSDDAMVVTGHTLKMQEV